MSVKRLVWFAVIAAFVVAGCLPEARTLSDVDVTIRVDGSGNCTSVDPPDVQLTIGKEQAHWMTDPRGRDFRIEWKGVPGEKDFFGTIASISGEARSGPPRQPPSLGDRWTYRVAMTATGAQPCDPKIVWR